MPFEKLWEYDCTFHGSLDTRSVMDLFDMDFIDMQEIMNFLESPGVGEAHLAATQAIKAFCSGFSICFAMMQESISKLKKEAGGSPAGDGIRT